MGRARERGRVDTVESSDIDTQGSASVARTVSGRTFPSMLNLLECKFQ